MPEKDTDSKLDAIASHLDSLHKRFDAMEGDRKADKARMDAMDEWKSKCDADEKTRADKMRADAEAKEKDDKEKADKAKADAEAKEKDDKEKADKAKADAEAKEKADAAAAAAAATAGHSDFAKQIAELQARIPAVLSNEDKGKFAAAQMRFDAAYQAWGEQAPHALHGETLSDYRVRLASKMKVHSKAYKDSNLAAIAAADETAFSNIEGMIINDSVSASTSNVTHGAPLVARTKVDPLTNHRVTTFHGDPSVWMAEFAGGHTMFGKLNLPQQRNNTH